MLQIPSRTSRAPKAARSHPESAGTEAGDPAGTSRPMALALASVNHNCAAATRGITGRIVSRW